MQKLRILKIKAFSLVELMVIIAIVATLSYVAVSSYRDYADRATIAALIPLAGQAKIEVEDAHNQGTIFGTTDTHDYVESAQTDKPLGLDYIRRVSYGCVNVAIDLADLNLTPANTLIMTWCPTAAENYIEWRCGYDAASSSEYLSLLPGDCQSSSTAIRDTSF